MPHVNLPARLTAHADALDYEEAAQRLCDAAADEFPSWLLEQRQWYASRLLAMRCEPNAPCHVRCLNLTRFLWTPVFKGAARDATGNIVGSTATPSVPGSSGPERTTPS